MNWLIRIPDLLKGGAAVATIIPVVIGALFWVYRHGFKRGRDQVSHELLRKRFELLYAPMLALFLTRHVTSAKAVMAAYLRSRVRNALSQAKRGRLVSATKALFDRQETKQTAEIEFGGTFPLDQIHRILSGHESYADEQLLEWIARADRSRYEDSEEYGLTDAEYGLFQHIAATHSRLSKRLFPDD
ncbi:MAG: hypothetical protein M3O82_01175 [Verrucomicrobiota bacterium]|nr:hypothetical protein [Verrucomicrobiota bacterium]